MAAAVLMGVAVSPVCAQLLGGVGRTPGGTGGLGGMASGTLSGAGNLTGAAGRLGSATGSLSNSVTGAGSVTTSKSVNAKSGGVGPDAGLTDTVSSTTSGTLGASGPTGSVAGGSTTSTTNSIDKNASVNAQAIGTDQVASTAGALRNRATSTIGTARQVDIDRQQRARPGRVDRFTHPQRHFERGQQHTPHRERCKRHRLR